MDVYVHVFVHKYIAIQQWFCVIYVAFVHSCEQTCIGEGTKKQTGHVPSIFTISYSMEIYYFSIQMCLKSNYFCAPSLGLVEKYPALLLLSTYVEMLLSLLDNLHL